MKLRHANYHEIPARSSCHVPRERAVLDLIALRKPDTAIFSELWKKKSIPILHVVDMLFHWTDNLNFFSFFTVQFYQTCRLSDETKKILGPKINPPNFQALISPIREIFPRRINVRISKCLWLVYSSYHPLKFTFSHLTVWTARPALYACDTTPIRLFWIPFDIPTYIKPPKMSIDIYIFQIVLSPNKSRDQKFQNKKEIPLASR